MLPSTARPPASLAELLPPDLAARLDRLDLLSRKVFAGKMQGERRSKRRGRSVEFEDYRPYVPGDDLRHIDWNVYARLDRLFLRVFQEEEDLALHLVLDMSPSMQAGTPSKFLCAQRLSMALAYLGLVNANRVMVTAFGAGRIRRLQPSRGRRSIQRVAAFLLELGESALRAVPDGEPAPDFTAALRSVGRAPGGRGVVVLVSDLLIPGGYEAGLRALAGAARSARAGAALDVVVVQVLSPGELDPSHEHAAGPGGLGGDVRLIDVETGRETEVTITAPVLARYRAGVQSYLERARAFCVARGMHHVQFASDADLGVLLLRELRRRRVLG